MIPENLPMPVREGFLKISDKFASEKHIGPKMAADFEEIPSGERRDMPRRGAYEKVDYLLKAAGFELKSTFHRKGLDL